jgi:hypothetical protein
MVSALNVPLVPPPDCAYPVDDVITEATDIGGNHVALRPACYDATRGSGGTNIYRKHALINPNAFKDLRPPNS